MRTAVWLGENPSVDKLTTSVAPRESMAKRAGRIGFEQKTAVGIGDGDGAIQHGLEHSVERKLRMQQHGRFEQQIEFAEANRRRLAGGDTPNAGEQVLDCSTGAGKWKMTCRSLRDRT